MSTEIDRSSLWQRALFMLLYAVLWGLAEIVLATVAIGQWLFAMFGGEVNPRLHDFGRSLSLYLYQIAQFQTFIVETKPFPFGDWPAPNTDSQTAKNQQNITSE